MSWHVGDLWKITATITDPETKAAVDPVTVTVAVTSPNGTGSAPTASKSGTGIYKASINLTEAGGWHAVISTTGTYQAARPVSIRVLED